jgi:NADH-quinone oxidoreductase subunit K
MQFWEPITWSIPDLTFYAPDEQEQEMVSTFIFLGHTVFSIGLVGLLYYRTSLLYCLISIEVMLVGLNFSLIFLGQLTDQTYCQILVLIILTISAIETALGLVLVLLYYLNYATTRFEFFERIDA